MKFKLSKPIYVFAAAAMGLAIYNAELHVSLKWMLASVVAGFAASFIGLSET